jgi:hypothetical protein
MTKTETPTTNSEYNGWANHSTWNVSLWISNDENLCNAACKAVDTLKHRGTLDATITPEWAKAFCRVEFASAFKNEQTPDGIGINDPNIDWSAIADMIKELA